MARTQLCGKSQQRYAHSWRRRAETAEPMPRWGRDGSSRLCQSFQCRKRKKGLPDWGGMETRRLPRRQREAGVVNEAGQQLCWEGPWTATNPVPCFPDTETETAQKVSLGSAGPQASARVPCVLLGTSCSSLTVSLSKSIFNITTVLTSCKGSSPRRTKYVQKLFPKRTTLFFFSSSNKTV